MVPAIVDLQIGNRLIRQIARLEGHKLSRCATEQERDENYGDSDPGVSEAEPPYGEEYQCCLPFRMIVNSVYDWLFKAQNASDDSEADTMTCITFANLARRASKFKS